MAQAYTLAHSIDIVEKRTSIHKGISLVGFIESSEHVNCGGLAGSIVPEKSHDLVLLDLKVELVYGLEVAEFLSESLDLDC